MLTIRAENREAARGNLRTPEGRAAIERFFEEHCADELRGPPKVLQAADHSFSDVAKKVVSIINLASVADLENATGAPVHPLRFRGNLYRRRLAGVARVRSGRLPRSLSAKTCG